MTSHDTNKEQQEAGPTLEEQVEHAVRMKLASMDVLGGVLPGHEKTHALRVAIVASIRKLQECERDAGRYRMAQENLCGSDHEARHHMDDALDEQICAIHSDTGGGV